MVPNEKNIFWASAEKNRHFFLRNEEEMNQKIKTFLSLIGGSLEKVPLMTGKFDCQGRLLTSQVITYFFPGTLK